MPKAKVSKSDPIFLKKPRNSKVIARLSGDRSAERILKGSDINIDIDFDMDF